MAVSAQLERSDIYGVKMLEKETTVTVASGSGSLVINLDETFLNTPLMLCIPENGADGTYTLAYDSATPKITLTVATETVLANAVVRIIAMAYDKP